MELHSNWDQAELEVCGKSSLKTGFTVGNLTIKRILVLKVDLIYILYFLTLHVPSAFLLHSKRAIVQSEMSKWHVCHCPSIRIQEYWFKYINTCYYENIIVWSINQFTIISGLLVNILIEYISEIITHFVHTVIVLALHGKQFDTF